MTRGARHTLGSVTVLRLRRFMFCSAASVCFVSAASLRARFFPVGRDASGCPWGESSLAHGELSVESCGTACRLPPTAGFCAAAFPCEASEFDI